MIRRCILLLSSLGFAGILVLLGQAQAADLPSRAAPPVFIPPPLFTWTGLYAGAHVGYASAHDRFNLTTIPAMAGDSPSGVIGGIHVGYNYQANQFVAGIEGDVDGTSASQSAFDPVTGTTLGTRIPVEGSIRGRAGFAFDRTLFYATGGAAFADLRNSFSGGITPFYSTSSGRVGWTAGGGVEYAVTNNWSVRGEYRYSDFGHQTIAIAPAAVPVDSHATEHAVRVGFSYKFEMYAPPPPVAAKY